MIRAAEITLQPQPFTLEKKLTATVMPLSPVTPVPEAPKRWSDFTIRTLAAHGSRVSKGQKLIEFDPESLDRKLDDARRSITTKALTLEQAEQDLAHLVATRENRLEALRTAARIAREDNEYFVKTSRDAQSRKADQQRDRARQYLDNQAEELRQLEKMYAADDLTEETEEIILTRQKDQVEAAKFALEMETLSQKRTKEVLLPREAIERSDRERDASITWKQAEQSIPRAIELKKAEVESLQIDLQRERESLAELENDRKLMTITAHSDGWFYHGLIENGRWITGEMIKPLVPGGRPLMNRPFATFIPGKSTVGLIAQADGATARSLGKDQSAMAFFPGREDITFEAHLHEIAVVPSPDGQHAMAFKAEWPKDASPVVGSQAELRCIAYHKDQALVVPSQALTFGPRGWEVPVKRADGKIEQRAVKRGRISGSSVEILEGLEAGQVIIVPATP